MGRGLTFILILFSFWSFAEEASDQIVETNLQKTEEKPLAFSLTTSVGTTFSPEDAQTAVLLEPSLKWNVSKSTAVILYSAIDRPFDKYENFAVPKTFVLGTQQFQLIDGVKTTARLSINAMNLHRWSTDGYMVRTQGGLQASKEIFSGFTVMARTSVFGQVNQYAQATSGKDLPRVGFSERLTLSYQWKGFSAGVHLILGQRYHQTWKNDYYTAEELKYSIDDQYTVGIMHELLSSVIDSTTGFRQPVRLFDGRESRVSAVVEVSL